MIIYKISSTAWFEFSQKKKKNIIFRRNSRKLVRDCNQQVSTILQKVYEFRWLLTLAKNLPSKITRNLSTSFTRTLHDIAKKPDDFQRQWQKCDVNIGKTIGQAFDRLWTQYIGPTSTCYAFFLIIVAGETFGRKPRFLARLTGRARDTTFPLCNFTSRSQQEMHSQAATTRAIDLVLKYS